jgi:hypothetical protein
MIVLGENRLPTSFCTTTHGLAFLTSFPTVGSRFTSTTSPRVILPGVHRRKRLGPGRFEPAVDYQMHRSMQYPESIFAVYYKELIAILIVFFRFKYVLI